MLRYGGGGHRGRHLPGAARQAERGARRDRHRGHRARPGRVSTGVTAPDRATIARRAMHDRDGTTVGYQLVFRPGGSLAADPQAADASVADMILTAFGQFGLDKWGNRRNFHLGMPRSLLTRRPAAAVRTIPRGAGGAGRGQLRLRRRAAGAVALRQAIVLAGRRTLSAWVMLATLGGRPEARREDLVEILARARVCELLAPRLTGVAPVTAATLGLLSALVELLGVDLVQAARSARLEESQQAALAAGEGADEAVLAAVSAFARTGSSLPPVRTEVLSGSYLAALDHALAAIDAIMGPSTGVPGAPT